jgi:hypothetical protein
MYKKFRIYELRFRVPQNVLSNLIWEIELEILYLGNNGWELVGVLDSVYFMRIFGSGPCNLDQETG